MHGCSIGKIKFDFNCREISSGFINEIKNYKESFSANTVITFAKNSFSYAPIFSATRSGESLV